MKGYDKAPSGAVDRARQLRRNATDAEKRLWRALREAFPDAKFRRQTPVGPYIADFLSFRHKLIVEADGGQHTPEIDAARTRYLRQEGYTVLRFWNNDALTNAEGVLAQISLSLREREGAPKARKGEGDRMKGCDMSAIRLRRSSTPPAATADCEMARALIFVAPRKRGSGRIAG